MVKKSIFSCHLSSEHVTAGFWQTFITQKVNTTERLVGVLPVCSGDQSPPKYACVLFYNIFTALFREHIPIQEQLAASGKTHLIFSYFDSYTSFYRPNHVLKCRVTAKRKLIPLIHVP